MKIIHSRGRVALIVPPPSICPSSPDSAFSTSTRSKKPAAKEASHSRYVSPPGYITGVVQGEKGPKPACGSLPRPRTFKRTSSRSSSPTIKAASCCPNCRRQLQGLGARLRTCGFDSGRRETSATALTLKVTTAKTPQEAAKVYPGDYWLSMMAPPARICSLERATVRTAQRPGKHDDRPGPLDQLPEVGLQLLPPAGQCADPRRQACLRRQAGAQRPMPEAWEWRLGVGVRGTNMYGLLGQMGKDPTLKSLSDWTEAIEQGEVPPAPPVRTGSSATSSRPCGMSATTTPSCTIRFRPTRTIPP